MIKHIAPAPTVTAYQAVAHALKQGMPLEHHNVLRLVAVAELVANGIQGEEHLKAALEAFVESLTYWEDREEVDLQ
jgi:hypothetical protein